jgi:glycine C-acetyltransferase
VSCWNANEGLTAAIVEAGDFVVSDALNHASIIDSLRLAKAITKCTTAVYAHSDMDDLVAKLESARDARRRIIWTDGVFSMEGSIAKLPEILDIAKKYDAIVAVDDSHATGVLGQDRTWNGGALRPGRRNRHHYFDARQSAWWSCRRFCRRPRLRCAIR